MAITTVLIPPQTSDPANFDSKADKFLTDLITWTAEANETANALNLNDTNGTSASSVLIGTGSKTFTANTGKSWQLGMTLKIASTASPANNMTGDVTAYNSGTGSLTVNVTSTAGSGTLAAWTISQSGVGILPGYFVSGSDINITASGTVTVPAIGTLFNLTAASAFNITGFATTSNGREFSIRSNPDKLLTLVNSASLKLIGNSSRVMASGEVAHFTQTASGVYTEVGQQTVIDMTGYTGADIALGVGQSALYNISSVTSLLLRIATATQQQYEVLINPTFITGVVTAGSTTLSMNNTTLGTNWPAWFNQANITATTVSSGTIAGGVLTLTGGGSTPRQIIARLLTNTNGKSFQSTYASSSNTANFVGYIQSACQDTTTAWNSLGTINFISAASGDVVVRRIY
jgi:hypothetical protein